MPLNAHRKFVRNIDAFVTGERDAEVRATPKVSPDTRCATCHDDGAGLMFCQCQTALHASCMIEFGCPTCGAKDDMGRTLEDQKRDFVALWGADHFVESDWVQIRRAEEGPQEEPTCKHKWDEEEKECVFCHAQFGNEHALEEWMRAERELDREDALFEARMRTSQRSEDDEPIFGIWPFPTRRALNAWANGFMIVLQMTIFLLLPCTIILFASTAFLGLIFYGIYSL